MMLGRSGSGYWGVRIESSFLRFTTENPHWGFLVWSSYRGLLKLLIMQNLAGVCMIRLWYKRALDRVDKEITFCNKKTFYRKNVSIRCKQILHRLQSVIWDLIRQIDNDFTMIPRWFHSGNRGFQWNHFISIDIEHKCGFRTTRLSDVFRLAVARRVYSAFLHTSFILAPRQAMHPIDWQAI